MEQKVKVNNYVSLIGTVFSGPTFNHQLHGETYYLFTLEVTRSSENVDRIPIMISSNLLNVNIGDRCKVTGHYRSHNLKDDDKQRLILSVFAKDIYKIVDEHEEDKNLIILEGFIGKEPSYRETPLGKEITELLVAVNRPYKKSDYIPCITWGKNARTSAYLKVGTPIRIVGRVQSRE